MKKLKLMRMGALQGAVLAVKRGTVVKAVAAFGGPNWDL